VGVPNLWAIESLLSQFIAGARQHVGETPDDVLWQCHLHAMIRMGGLCLEEIRKLSSPSAR
jgi:hypothetical protein